MSLHIPANFSVTYITGLSATNAMATPSIRANDLILAVITVAPTASIDGHDNTDYTVGDGTITAGTIDNTGLTLMVIHTNAP